MWPARGRWGCSVDDTEDRIRALGEAEWDPPLAGSFAQLRGEQETGSEEQSDDGLE